MSNEQVYTLDKNEIELLKYIRSGEYNKVVVNFKKGKMHSAALVKDQNTKKRIVDLLNESDFQEISIKRHNGKNTRIQNVIKLIFK